MAQGVDKAGEAGIQGISRRDFLGAAAAILAGLALPGCSEEESSGPADLAGLVQEVGGHKHAVVLKGSDIEAGAAVTLTLTGGDHSHTLTLTADQVKEVKSNGMLHELVSSNDSGHTHRVDFMR